MTYLSTIATPPTVFDDGLPNGWFDPGDVAFYREIYEDFVPIGGRTVEVGCLFGRSLCSVADIIRRKHILVDAVDLFRSPSLDWSRAFVAALTRFKLRDFVTVYQGDSIEISRDIPDASLHFVFIDGDHAVESVRKDIRAWLPKLRLNGWLGGHDLNEAGVNAALEDAAFDNMQTRSESHIWLTQKRS